MPGAGYLYRIQKTLTLPENQAPHPERHPVLRGADLTLSLAFSMERDRRAARGNHGSRDGGCRCAAVALKITLTGDRNSLSEVIRVEGIERKHLGLHGYARLGDEAAVDFLVMTQMVLPAFVNRPRRKTPDLF